MQHVVMEQSATPPDALTELALHCESKQRRLEAIAERLSGYASLRKAPESFRAEAEHYRSFCKLLRRVQARRRPAIRRARQLCLAPGEHGTDVTIEQSFREVMRMRLRERDRDLVRSGYRRLLASVRSARGRSRHLGFGPKPPGDSP